ncbi:MAG: redox-regulated ATPase YchF [Thermoplasmata archaeon]|nr:redox-regulated ATPase YchF [Thermoplasmata archaeon]
MEVGVVGKPNVGKSTFFNALTLLDVPVAPYPFTTVKPNRGVAAVRTPCPDSERGLHCTPGNARCVQGTRWVPVNVIDVPGLVPGAHEGKGLGHQFLDELRPADGFVHVVDITGGTAPDGAIVAPGTHDPSDEVPWLEEELVHWVAGILGRDFDHHAKSIELQGGKVEEFLHEKLTGLSIPMSAITQALRESPVDRAHPARWSAADRRGLAKLLLRVAKPRVIAANKCDKVDRPAAEALAGALDPLPVVPTSAEAELTLRRAARADLVDYAPGASTFSVNDPGKLSAGQRRALEEIRGILDRWGSTGVQGALERLIFERLGYVVVFPVEDETKWTDSKGRILPDALLVPGGTAVRAVAYRVHSDLGDHFIRAIDGRTQRALAADHPVEHRAVLRFVARR